MKDAMKELRYYIEIHGNANEEHPTFHKLFFLNRANLKESTDGQIGELNYGLMRNMCHHSLSFTPLTAARQHVNS